MITEFEKISYSELRKLIKYATRTSNNDLKKFLSKVWDNEHWNSILHKYNGNRKDNWLWWKFGVRELIHIRHCV